MGQLEIHRGRVLHFHDNPGDTLCNAATEYIRDAALLVRDGCIERLTEWSQIDAVTRANACIHEHHDQLICPGFIDTHIHYPQLAVIASYGTQLLDWLKNYTFPAEQRFADPQHACKSAEFFLTELLRNGTTSAMVFATVHAHSATALFEAALSRNMRIICGKVLMDRNCPDYLRDTPESGYQESKQLIEHWHGKARLAYAITPRFAPTSTPEQLKRAGDLYREYPEIYLHTHLAENQAEIAWVKQLFPEASSYLDVYRQFGLLNNHSVFAHGIHLDQDDRKKLGDTGGALAFCPSSNLFLGSGLFDLHATETATIKLGLGTDIGGGTSFSMLRTMGDAYKVSQLKQQPLAPSLAFYLATLGGARALNLEHHIGNFEPGKEADFIVLKTDTTPLLKYRSSIAKNLAEELFILATMGDERNIAATYVLGKQCTLESHPPIKPLNT